MHDAANILRRYFNHLPEPIIPLGNYDSFRDPLRDHQAEAVGPLEGQSPSTGGFDPDAAVRTYQHHIKELPSLNRQLLLYILDLLAVFAAKSDVNKMTTHNLAAIFQPGILSHPQHDMSPADYRLSQDVLIFLIDNQDHFLIGMEGTAVDEGTVKHIESGPSTPQAMTPTTPGRNGTGIGRSISAASSAGAESVRKYSGVRRNVSTSSKRSRTSAVPSPITPAVGSPTTSGVHRSNTLPSKRSPALNSPRFPRDVSGPSTPSADEKKSSFTSPIAAEAAAIVASLGPVSKSPVLVSSSAKEAEVSEPIEEVSEQASPKRAQTMPPARIEMPPAMPMAPIPQGRPAAVTPAYDAVPGAFPLPSPGIIPPSQDVTPSATAQTASELLPVHAPASGRRSPHLTPTRERSEFMEAPIDSGLTVEPTPATRTFTQILGKTAVSPSSDGKDGRKPNKLQKKRAPTSANASAHSSTQDLNGGDPGVGMVPILPAQHSPLHPPQPPFAHGYSQGSGSKEALASNSNDTNSSRNSGTTLKPSMSPSPSFRSHSTATEYSEAGEPTEEAKEEKRSFWKAHKRGDSRATPTASQTDLHGSVPGGDKSMSSFGSSSGWGGGSRRSLQYDSHQNTDLSTAYGSPPEHEKTEKKEGAFGWFHKMRSDHRDRADKRERAKSPPGSSSHMPQPQNLKTPPKDSGDGRGRSMDAPRSNNEAANAGSAQHPSVPNTNAAAAGKAAYSRHDARQTVPIRDTNAATSAAASAATRQAAPIAPDQSVATSAAASAASRQVAPIALDQSAATTAAAALAVSRHGAQQQAIAPQSSASAPQMVSAAPPTSQQATASEPQPAMSNLAPQPVVSDPTAPSTQAASIATETPRPVTPVQQTSQPASTVHGDTTPSANAPRAS